MKKILVTGCNGQLGRAINQEYQNEASLVNTDIEDLDITDVKKVLDFVMEKKPDVIINCAAYTAVDKCEDEKDLAYRINAIGPRNLSIAATKAGAKLIHVSTDYVFEGNGSKPYKETDEPLPETAYGRTKLLGEEFVKAFAKEYFIIRTAWLYGEGHNFVKTMLKLAETNDEINVVNDQFGSPTSTRQLAKMIHYLEPTCNYGIFHGTCEGECSWAEFAEEIFSLAGKSIKVNYIPTHQYPTRAKRPAYSVLENYMLKLTTDFQFEHWKTAIEQYVKGEGGLFR